MSATHSTPTRPDASSQAEVGLDPAEFDRKLLDLLASDMHLRTEVARRLLPPIDETPVIPGIEDPYEVDERFYWGFTDRPIAGHTTWLFYDSKAKTIVGVVYHYPGEGLRRLDDGEWTADTGQPAWYCIFSAEAGEHELLGPTESGRIPLPRRPRTDRIEPWPKQRCCSNSALCAGSKAATRDLSHPRRRLAAVTDLVAFPTPRAISPYVTAQSVRVSADVLASEDPAAALAARFLLRHPEGTRNVYRTDLQEWFAFCERSLRPFALAPARTLEVAPPPCGCW